MILRTKRALVLAAVSLLVTVMFATSVQAQGKGNTWHSLRYTFKPGEKLKYALTKTESGTATVTAGGGRETMPVNTKMNTDLFYDVVDVDSQGTATVKVSMGEMEHELYRMGQSLTVRLGAAGVKVYAGGELLFDSSQMGGVDDADVLKMLGVGGLPNGIPLASLFTKGVTVTITRSGEMAVPALPDTGGESYLGLLEVFEPQSLSKALLRPGDTWTTDVPVPGVDTAGSDVPLPQENNVFEGIETFNGRRCAKIVSRLDADLSGIYSEQEPALQMRVLKSQGEATIYIDLEQGRMLKVVAEFSQDLGGRVPLGLEGLATNAGGAAESIEVTASVETAVEVELKE